jgi:tetratricopeptide (TPR) repeat protein
LKRSARAVPWDVLATALLLACACVPLLSRVRDVVATDRSVYCRDDSDYHVERGGAILHGIPVFGVSRAMPFYSVPNAYLCRRLPEGGALAARSGVLLAGAALVFALGAELYSAPAGALAVFLYALLPSSGAGGERWLYTLLVLFVSYFLVRRARAPAPSNDAMLGAALGASLLVLSPLFLFPYVLFLYELSRRKEGLGAAPIRDASLLCLLPFVFLVPWAVMNWRLSGRLVLFEDGRADDNVITGALGFVRTMGSGDSRGLAGLSPGQSVLVWAGREILLHPLRFLTSVLARAVAALRPHPWLAVAAAFSTWICRKREDCRQLSLLAAYFFMIHCLMPVQDSYFVPIWPVLAVLASGVLAPLAGPVGERWRSAGLKAVMSSMTAVLLAQAYVLALVSVYPARAAEPLALERELARDPGDPWLWSERGMGSLRAGRVEEASEDLARAFELDPHKDREIRYAWALLEKKGAGAGIWEDLRPGPGGMLIDLRARVLRAVYLALNGRRTEAAGALAESRAFACSSGSISNALPLVVLETASIWPVAGRPKLIRFFEDEPALRGLIEKDAWARAWLETGRLSSAAGDGRAAVASLDSAEKDGLGDDEEFAAAAAALERGDEPFAALLLSRLRETRPERADRLLDMAATAAKSRRPAEAARILALAGKSFPLDPERTRRAASIDASFAATSKDDDEARRRLLLHQERREYAAAMKIANGRVAARPRDARWRSDRGVLRALLGEREAAETDLKSALALDPDLLAPYLSLGSLYSSWGREKEAAALYIEALRRPQIGQDARSSRQVQAALEKLSPPQGRVK